MTETSHDELIDHGFGTQARADDVPDVIEMGPVHGDDIEVIAMGPVAEPRDDIEVIPDEPALIDEVPVVDAWEQEIPADPDAPPRPAPGTGFDHEVPAADAWEQSLPTDRYDDY